MGNIGTKQPSKLQVHNKHLLSYVDTLDSAEITLDLLGGVDLSHIEHLICTIRIQYKNLPPIRCTLDLYREHQLDKLLRDICNKYEVGFIEVSTIMQDMILAVENYRLRHLRYTEQPSGREHLMTDQEKKKVLQRLKSKNLIEGIQDDLQILGMAGHEKQALIILLTLASCKYHRPYSLLCLRQDAWQQHHFLHHLADCLPPQSCSYHSQMSENALYYFHSPELDRKALIIGDVDWTAQMISSLCALKQQGKLIKTRATKNKEGLLQATTFRVSARMSIVACAYPKHKGERWQVPFLTIPLSASANQNELRMQYDKRIRMGEIGESDIQDVKKSLQNMLALLDDIQIINPYVSEIQLPSDLSNQNRILTLLLDFVEVVCFFRQHQRTKKNNEKTGSIYYEVHPDDIELSFDLLKEYLFQEMDELGVATRKFYEWLSKHTQEKSTDISSEENAQFTALDIRKAQGIHARTLNRYLSELRMLNYVEVVGGNKHRSGYIYKLTDIENGKDKGNAIEKCLAENMKRIRKKYKQENIKTANGKNKS